MPLPQPTFKLGASLCLGTLSLMLTLSSYGVFMNDEGGQLEGFRAMRQGSWEIQEDSPHFFAAGDNFTVPDIWDNQHRGKIFVNIAAIPTYYLLWVLNPIISPFTLLLLAWAGSTYVTIRTGWSAWYQWRRKREWKWYNKPGIEGTWHKRFKHRLQTMTIGHWTLTGVLFVWTLIQLIQQQRVDYSLWGEIIAIQTTHIFLSALAAPLFYMAVRTATESSRAATIAFAAYLCSPILFWSLGIKYHASAIALTTFAIFLYQRQESRYWGIAAAAVALLSTVLTAPVLLSMLAIEATTFLRAARRGAFKGQGRRIGIATGAVAAAITATAWLNQQFYGKVLGKHGPNNLAFTEGNLATNMLEWVERASRFDSWEQSWSNLLGLLFWSDKMEDGPLAFLALAPLMVMAVFVPIKLWREKRMTRMAAFCMLHTAIFLAAFIHGAHEQGIAILDHRFFVTAIPPLLVLAAIAIRDRVEAMDKDDLMFIPKGFGLGLAFVVPILLFLGTNDIALYPERETHQLVRASWAVGFAGMGAMIATTIWRSKIGARKADRFWAIATGYAFISPFIWLFMMTILVIRQIPTWPFGSDAASFDYLLPSLEGLRWWWGPKLLP